jgi:hypothetical protein
MGLQLDEKAIDQIRSEAVKSAVQAVKNITGTGKEGEKDFATFSTFSTFGSGFGSGVA